MRKIICFLLVSIVCFGVFGATAMAAPVQVSKPTSPRISVRVNSDQTVTLTWNFVNGAAQYYPYYSIGQKLLLNEYDDKPVTGTSYTHSF